ncbi:MAG: SDR family oxidoreductase [Chloroflexi bacterium]|nr:MAG: SDR family oxidoreductase [Chloroflexota bacterium]
MTDFDFSNKQVLITGASRGIGRACAIMFAERGAKVAVHYGHNEEAAAETLSRLSGSGHFMVQADMADADAVRQMVDRTARQLGGIDVLVNNAGIYEEHPLDNVTYGEWLAAWERIISVNLLGAANAAYCAAQHMMRSGGGRIVNVSSRGAFRGEPEAPAYGASKAAMNAMGQSLAKALARYQIFVGTVAPGWVETDMAKEHLARPEGEAIRAQSPLNRVATPEEVAYAVLFMASDMAAFTTGAILDVNGASYLRT